jgi:hypothetical protein
MPLRPTETGPKVEAIQKHHAKMPTVRPGEHLWIVAGVWRVANPTAEQFMLDTENLLSLEGPGCYVCEEDYSPDLAMRRCPGEPSR